jgi:hypothetical protein
VARRHAEHRLVGGAPDRVPWAGRRRQPRREAIARRDGNASGAAAGAHSLTARDSYAPESLGWRREESLSATALDAGRCGGAEHLTLIENERQDEMETDKTTEDDPPPLLACRDESRGCAAEEDDLNKQPPSVRKS